MTAVISRTFFDDVFKDFPSGYFVRPLHGDNLPSPDQIRIDVQESGPDYIVHADIPGVRRDDIQVTIDGNQVSLTAEIRQEDRKIEDGKVLHSERYQGAVTRSFKLPVEIDQAAAKARYQDGVLTLTLPKASARNTRLVIE
jgi:HSP20 family protein